MSDFADTSRRLFEALQAEEGARRDARAAAERVAVLEDERAALARVARPGHQGHEERAAALQARIDDARAEMDAAAKHLENAIAEHTRHADVFVPFTDPTEHIGEKSAAYPFLLFPLRIETRFKTVEEEGASREQLWVRAYPDDCMIDTFESLLSEDELESVRTFWVNWARAGGVADEERGAWRTLVAGFASGRSAWMIEQYRPSNLDALPSKQPGGVVLVVLPPVPLPDDEREDIGAYWTGVWKAQGDPGQLDAARQALVEALGEARAAEVIEQLVPENLDETPEGPFSPDEVDVRVAFVDLPDYDGLRTQRLSWSTPPTVRVLPERLVVLGYRGGQLEVEALGAPIPATLQTGPNPLAAEGEQFSPLEGGDLDVGAAMRWMVDFDEAVRLGMGFRIDLEPEDVAQGFDRLLVVGVRLGADESAGKTLLEELIADHERSTAGFSILPQGTPTNNTEEGPSGFSESEDSDDSFEHVFGDAEPLTPTSDFSTRLDAQWLADMLGLDLATFDTTLGNRGRDQCEARAMNYALWPATWGYTLETMMAPLIDEPTRRKVHWFFTTFVTGRGLLPALRIGDQPYGVLPTTTFSRMAWLDEDGWTRPETLAHPDDFRAFLRALRDLLAMVHDRWEMMSASVSHVGADGDPHQVMLDVLGLNPGSVEFHQRYAESLEELTNRMELEGYGSEIAGLMFVYPYVVSGLMLLAQLGSESGEIPEILEKFFMQDANPLTGPLVDDVPLSEIDPIRPYTDGGDNYIEWLIETARTSFDTLRRQEGFTDGKPPTALLYLLLRHAVELGYWDAGARLFEESGTLSKVEEATLRVEPSFIHIAELDPNRPAEAMTVRDGDGLETSNKPIRLDRRSESRYEYLYRAEPAITGDPDLLVVDYIRREEVLGGATETRDLRGQLEALEHLADAPTARLERALVEHLDLCTYRLDSWRWGLLHYQLAVMRYGGLDRDARVRKGVFLGAFGWLEDVRREERELTPVELEGSLAGVFGGDDEPTLMRDSSNGGFVHAPSLNHAVTAAVLRNGYIAEASPEASDLFAVNLSSERVRAALGIVEGVRNGQRLGALLGYRLERGLHDRYDQAEVDAYIYELRRAFPLVADHIDDTVAPPDAPIEAIEARNVVDGLRLVEHVNAGRPLPPAPPGQQAAIDAEVERLRATFDAVADLAVAEGVYQAVQGNYDRTGATLEAYAQGTFPPEPEVVRTPRGGTGLVHRVGLHLEVGLDHNQSPNGLNPTPRSLAEPALNKWLDGVLPDPADVVCSVRYFDVATGGTVEVEVRQADLGLQPIDLLYVLTLESEQAMSALDDRIVQMVLTGAGVRPDADVTIDYGTPVADRFTFLEVGALVGRLRSLVLRSRPLEATDVRLVSESTSDADTSVHLDEARLIDAVAALEALLDDPLDDDLGQLLLAMEAALDALQTALDGVAVAAAELAEAPEGADTAALEGAHAAATLAYEAAQDDVIEAVDGWLDRYLGFADRAGFFGLGAGATGGASAWRRARFGALLTQVRERTVRWEERLADFDDLIASLQDLADDQQRLEALTHAERLISTTFTVPRPGDWTVYRDGLEADRDDFVGRLDALNEVLLTTDVQLADLIAEVDGLLPLDAFDPTPFDLESHRDEVVRFSRDLLVLVRNLSTELEGRRDDAQTMLDDANETADLRKRVELRAGAAEALFGDDFKIVPEFDLGADAAEEWDKAFGDRDELLSHLTAPDGEDRDFPVDDWLYGAARVREKLADLEAVAMLADGFETSVPELRPIQLPYRESDRWLALPYPDDAHPDGDRLLYTAHYAVPFDKAARQCGLLLDEWTEVLPSREVTTGVAFHYDRPDSEPPQVMLLVTSPHLDGGWKWQDLVDALHETLDAARVRGVEPTQVDQTAFARFLPATIMASTRHPITISLDLAANNGLLFQLQEPADA